MRLTPSSSSLIDIIRDRAERQPDDTAYAFLDAGEHEGARITWSALDRRCRALGGAIAARVRPGSRVLILFPPGIEFAIGFFGALYGGAIAVPAYPPSGGRTGRAVARLRALSVDADFSLVVAPASVAAHRPQIDAVLPELSRLPWLVLEDADDRANPNWTPPGRRPDTVAFLQYTSGSTAAPRGVIVTDGNLAANLGASAALGRHDASSVIVSWLPVNHDMGLIQGVLQPAYSGVPAYLMSPAAFLQRPVRWLQAISRLRATHSGGPNFAYDLCSRRVTDADRDGLDLSAWRVAFNGAEPVRQSTLEAFHGRFGSCGFRWNAFRPAYGLAESTLLVTSQRCGAEPAAFRGQAGALVSCGAPAAGTEVLIVDPRTRRRLHADRVGEIWIAGPSVAAGYWRRPHDSAETFRAHLATGEGPYLRTGDLGFLRGGELYVTGRLKDVIIVRGVKHYPQDIELTVEHAAPDVRPGCCAAFAFESLGEERAGIVAEIGRARGARESLEPTIEAIRRRVTEVHTIAPAAILLVTLGSLPKTTSGKLQRYVCREAFLAGALDVVSQWIDRDGPIGALEKAAS
jgi:acyl-CoA synthetase (AMP-forming)/AMP-acid ligase II